jgi:hypothetical protein
MKRMVVLVVGVGPFTINVTTNECSLDRQASETIFRLPTSIDNPPSFSVCASSGP